MSIVQEFEFDNVEVEGHDSAFVVEQISGEEIVIDVFTFLVRDTYQTFDTFFLGMFESRQSNTLFQCSGEEIKHVLLKEDELQKKLLPGDRTRKCNVLEFLNLLLSDRLAVVNVTVIEVSESNVFFRHLANMRCSKILSKQFSPRLVFLFLLERFDFLVEMVKGSMWRS